MLWAYAIADRACAPDLAGGAIAEIEAIEIAEGMVVYAREIERAPEPTLDAIREHDRVVRAIAARTGAILPMRFGTRGARDALLRSVEGRALAIREGLAAVRGAEQVTIRIAGGPAEEPIGAAGGPGTRFLLERVRQRSPRLPGWETVAAELIAIARAEKIERGDPRTERVRVYHLIAREDLPRWIDAAERAREASADWALTIGAPAPPWAFVPEEIA